MLRELLRAVVCLALGAAPHVFAAAPTVTSISTTSSPPGPQLTNVTIGGSGFALGNSIPNPPGASAFGGHNYLYVNTALTWTEARTYCQNMNGHLATISSP